MTNETKMLATMILEIANTAQGWISRPTIKTEDLINEYLESNKQYEITTDEDGNAVKTFVGIKDEQLNNILKHLKTSIERDKTDHERYNSQISQKGENQLTLIKTMVKHYADVEEE